MTNLTGRPVYQKGEKRKLRMSKAPNADEQRRFDILGRMACALSPRWRHECWGRMTRHHCFTGQGGRKDHSKTIPLCLTHHVGDKGIDSVTKRVCKRAWQEKYDTEENLLAQTNERIAAGEYVKD